MKRALQVIEETGRGADFLSVMQGIADGLLDPHNIALHLLIDIGSFLAAESLSNVRYKGSVII